MKWHNLPNFITILRFLLIIPVVYFQLKGMHGIALIGFAIAGISDGLDGYLAKRFQWVSRLGSLLDPLADKTLLICVTGVLTYQQHIPLWLFVMFTVRDIVIVVGAIGYQLLFGKVPMEPNLSSKFNTFLQIVLVLSVLFALAFWPELDRFIGVLFFTVALTTLYSGLDYVVLWSRFAYQRSKAPKHGQ